MTPRPPTEITTEIAAMSDADLRANLCTVDWRGREFKEAALDELLWRQKQITNELVALALRD